MMTIEELLTLDPGSVVECDSLIMRTRFGNWVSDGGFLLEDDDLAIDVLAGHPFVLRHRALNHEKDSL